jgi:hypothetical protein
VTSSDANEYVALRATISHRGTARVYIFALGLSVWAMLTVAVLALALPPIAALVPLVALAATYEAVLALHVAVERIGRYLLVFHDDEWERRAGAFGRPAGAATVDPLFATPFLLAAVLGMMPLLATRPIVQEWVAVGTSVAAFAIRVLRSRVVARRQRAVDEKRFRELKTLPS